MVKLTLSLAFLPFFHDVDAFSSLSSFTNTNLPPSSLALQPRYPASTKLHVGAEIDPDEVLPLDQETILTPEGYGFSSTTGRILSVSDRRNGYYRATGSELVTNVMEGITDGTVDVALVFDDSSNQFLGIFTETDYIKVR